MIAQNLLANLETSICRVCDAEWGAKNAGLSDELWVFSTTRIEWTQSLNTSAGDIPSARTRSDMAAVGYNLYFFGGVITTDEGE